MNINDVISNDMLIDVKDLDTNLMNEVKLDVYNFLGNFNSISSSDYSKLLNKFIEYAVNDMYKFIHDYIVENNVVELIISRFSNENNENKELSLQFLLDYTINIKNIGTDEMVFGFLIPLLNESYDVAIISLVLEILDEIIYDDMKKANKITAGGIFDIIKDIIESRVMLDDKFVLETEKNAYYHYIKALTGFLETMMSFEEFRPDDYMTDILHWLFDCILFKNVELKIYTLDALTECFKCHFERCNNILYFSFIKPRKLNGELFLNLLASEDKKLINATITFLESLTGDEDSIEANKTLFHNMRDMNFCDFIKVFSQKNDIETVAKISFVVRIIIESYESANEEYFMSLMLLYIELMNKSSFDGKMEFFDVINLCCQKVPSETCEHFIHNPKELHFINDFIGFGDISFIEVAVDFLFNFIKNNIKFAYAIQTVVDIDVLENLLNEFETDLLMDECTQKIIEISDILNGK